MKGEEEEKAWCVKYILSLNEKSLYTVEGGLECSMGYFNIVDNNSNFHNWVTQRTKNF